MFPRTARPKLAAIVLVAACLLVAERAGLFRQLGDPAATARLLVSLGGWGYVCFVLSYAAFQPFGVPGTVFIVAAPLIWPWPVAFALSMTGTMAASSVGFAFARFVARDWVSGRIPLRFRRYEDALAARAFLTVFVLRLVFWMPPLLHAFFGVSRVRFATHFWASLAGYIPPVFLVSYFGQALFDRARALAPSTWVAAFALVVLALIGWALTRTLVRRARAAPPAH